MVVGTLKITDENYDDGTFMLWLGNHGHHFNVDNIRAITRNLHEGNVSRDMLALLCAQKLYAEARRLGVVPSDLTYAQCKAAIETPVEV